MSQIPEHEELLILLRDRLPAERAAAVVTHYREMIEQLQKSHWESTTVKAGKFVEAVLKCLWDHVGKTASDGKDFKVDVIIRELEKLPSSEAHDFIKLTIPRACRFIYDVASNRGARHDSVELNPNAMDANGVTATASWVVAELVRYSQEGKITPPEAAKLVARLTEKRYPLFEEIDGRLYFANIDLGARKLALLLLAYIYPERMAKEELIASLVRHGETRNNARLGISRLKNLIDDDGRACLRLRTVGLKEAEQLLRAQSS